MSLKRRSSSANFMYGASDRVFKMVTEGTGRNEILYGRGPDNSPLFEREQNYVSDVLLGQELTFYIYGPGGMVAKETRTGLTPPSSGPLSFYVKDHLGSTRVVLASGTGTVEASYDYSPFGEVMRASVTEESRYTYTGQESDGESGLMNYHARLYDPSIGRFGATDPAGQFNSPYAYVGNNPVSFTDPSGEFAILPILTTALKVYSYVRAAQALYRGVRDGGLEGGLLAGLQIGVGYALSAGLSHALPGQSISTSFTRGVVGSASSSLAFGNGINFRQSVSSGFSGALQQLGINLAVAHDTRDTPISVSTPDGQDVEIHQGQSYSDTSTRPYVVPAPRGTRRGSPFNVISVAYDYTIELGYFDVASGSIPLTVDFSARMAHNGLGSGVLVPGTMELNEGVRNFYRNAATTPPSGGARYLDGTRGNGPPIAVPIARANFSVDPGQPYWVKLATSFNLIEGYQPYWQNLNPATATFRAIQPVARRNRLFGIF